MMDKVNQVFKLGKQDFEVDGIYSRSVLIYKFPKRATPGFLYGLSHGAHVGAMKKKSSDKSVTPSRVDVNMAWHFKQAEFKDGFLAKQMIKTRINRLDGKIKAQNSGRASDVTDESLIESRDAWRDILKSEANGKSNDYLEVHFVMTFSSADQETLKKSLNTFTRNLRKSKGFKFKELKREQGRGIRAAWLLGSAEEITSKYPGQVVSQDQLAAFYPYLDGSVSRPEKGVYVGHRTYNGTTIHVDFTLGSDGQNILVIGKTGKGKSYWIKGLVEGLREAGFKVYISDPDGETKDKVEALGGIYLDLTTDNAIFIDPTVIIPALLKQIDPKAYSKADLKKIIEADHYRYQQAMDGTLSLISTLCDDKWDTDLSNATQEAFMRMYEAEGILKKDPTTWDRTQNSQNISIHKLYQVINMHGQGDALFKGYTPRFVEESRKLSNELWSYFEGANSFMFQNSKDYTEFSKYQLIGYKIATDLTDDSKPHVKKMARIRLSMISNLNLLLIQRDRLLKLGYSAEIFDEFQRSGKENDTKAVAYRAMTTSRKYNSMAIIGLNDPTVLEDGIWGNASHKVLFYTEKNLIDKTTENIQMTEEIVSKWRNLGQYEFVYVQSDPLSNKERADVGKMYLPEEENELGATRGVAAKKNVA